MKIDKKSLPIVAVVIIVLLGAGAFFLLRKSPGVPGSKNGDSMMMEKNGKSFTGTLSDLLKSGQNYNCTYGYTDENGNKMSGKAYVAAAGNKLNGEFEMTQGNGTKMNGFVISDGEYNYVWTSLESQGYRSKVEPGDDSIFNSSESSVGLNDQNQLDFNCSPWTVDNSKFVPPSDIKFVDLSAAMENMNDNAGTGEIDCSVCDTLPEGDAQNQCLQSLGC